jgi:T-complex protein 1 subunit alpha
MSVSILGSRESGQNIRDSNVRAVQAVANIVKSSLGPNGLDKMLVDEIGDVVISNDGATILRSLEVQHPAAKVLVELSRLQDQEVGDGTTSVVVVAAELLKRANDLVKYKIHPTMIIAGFRLAMKESIQYIKDCLSVKTDTLGHDAILSVAKTSLNSKLIGAESDHFASLIVNAVEAIGVTTASKETKYPIKSIKVLKCNGGSAKESIHLNGFALQATRTAQGMPMTVKNAKIACLDFNLNKFKLQMGVQVLVKDSKNLEQIRVRELEITKERIAKVLAAGANVVLTTKAIDDFALKYFVEAGAIAVRRVDKKDLRKIAKQSGAEVLTTLLTNEGEEQFSAGSLGTAEEVSEERVGDQDFIFIKGMKNTSAQTLILRGANEFMLEEVDRSVHDAICVVKRVLESKSVVVGGGAVETALSIYLDSFARTLGSKEQLAISEFAESLLVIPKTLAINAAQDACELLAKMKMYHAASQTSNEAKKQEYKFVGLDLANGKVRNNLKAGVLEPTISKIKSLKFATEAAISILRIDDLIELAPKQEKEEDGR